MKKNKKVFLLFLVVIILSSMFFNSRIIRAEPVYDINIISSKLKDKLIPLETTNAGNGFEDLQPLKKVLKDVKIIGMGEATHGTKEFFEMKHRMFEFLVEEMGYRAFAIESEFGCHRIINDYILHDKGSIEDTLKVMKFWTWSTKEVADMINWMKEYNKNPNNKEKIRFYGFDIQEVDSSMNNIIKYLELVDIDKRNDFKSISLNKPTSKTLLKETKDSFQKDRDKYISKSSILEYEIILQDLEVINQYLEYQEIRTKYFGGEIEDSNNSISNLFNTRDYNMAENVKWIIEHEKRHYNNNKIMLWAHNGHISNYYFNFLNMGRLLKEALGDEYYSLGFDFYKGSFNAIGQTTFRTKLGVLELDAPKKDIFSSYFKATNYPLSYLDLKTASSDKTLKEWLSKEHLMHLIGASLHEGAELQIIIPSQNYDGLIYIENTTAAQGFFSKYSKVNPLPIDEDGIKHLNPTQIIILSIKVAFILGIIIYTFKKRRTLKNLE
ncbi:erythromycin esterase family protein [Tissierella praeacuta]|uniref:erythromycin esterase family protein n=1 Tax=Tissierella praeacuta TaxID=43131 RepID=UPI003DA44C11